MTISSVASNMLSVQVNNSLTIANPSESEAAHFVDIEQQVKQNLRESVDYQIISKMMYDKQKELKEEISQSNNKSLTYEANENRSVTDNHQQDTVAVSEQAINAFVSSKEQASLSISRSDEVQQADPLALDLNGDGIQTTGVNNGILFDINGDGSKEQTSFVSGGDAFLAYDKNGNGVIDSGKELFGDSNGYAHGFAELATYDDNKDGQIDAADAIYDKLQLLRINNEGKHQLDKVNDFGITSIGVNYTEHQSAINQYDTITQLGQYAYENGKTGLTGDILLGYKK